MHRRALHALCVVALLVTAGCLGFASGGGGGDGAHGDTEELVADTERAMESVDTYRMNMTMHVAAEGDTYDLHRSGVFDSTSKQARLNLTANGTNTIAYLDGTTMYVEDNGTWRERPLADDTSWKSAVGLAQQRYLLENASVTVAGTETVDGVETTVLSVDPKDGKLRQLLTRSTTEDLGKITIEEASYDLYVAEASHRPQRVEINLQVTVEKNWDKSGHGSVAITFSAFDEPVNATIPERATA